MHVSPKVLCSLQHAGHHFRNGDLTGSKHRPCSLGSSCEEVINCAENKAGLREWRQENDGETSYYFMCTGQASPSKAMIQRRPGENGENVSCGLNIPGPWAGGECLAQLVRCKGGEGSGQRIRSRE